MEYIQRLIFHKRSWDDGEDYQSMLEGRQAAAADENPQPLHGFEGQAAACIHRDSRERFKTILAPTLVIWDEDDIFTPRWIADEMADVIPNNTLHLDPRSGHAFHWENIDDFNPRVRDSLRRIVRRFSKLTI